MPPVTREITEEIKTIVDVALKEIWKDDKFIKSISDKISSEINSTLNKKLKVIEKDVSAVKSEINTIKKEFIAYKTNCDSKVNELNSKITNYEEKLNKFDDMEQELKKNNLWIFKLQEKDSEETKTEVITLLNNKMNLNLSSDDIDVCHRIGKRDPGKTRGIFLQFSTFKMKRNIHNQKKLLKGTGVVIKEDLTKKRLLVLNEAIRRHTLANVWTENGTIMCKVDNKIIKL